MVLYELMHTGSGFAVRQVPAALRFFLNRTKFDSCVSPHAVKTVCLSAKGFRTNLGTTVVVGGGAGACVAQYFSSLFISRSIIY